MPTTLPAKARTTVRETDAMTKQRVTGGWCLASKTQHGVPFSELVYTWPLPLTILMNVEN